MYWISYSGSSAHPSFEKLERKTAADQPTFEALAFTRWGKDNQRGYFEGAAVLGSDPASFSAISGILATDDIRAWYGTEPIDGADGATFRLIGPQLAVDKSAAYSSGSRFVPCDVATFQPVDSEDGNFSADRKCVYFAVFRLPLQDRESFELIGAGYSKDRFAVYWHQDQVIGADMATFQLAPGTRLGRDKSGYWLGTEMKACLK
ncbi:DKNYY domain-containing protein [Hyphomonas sp.]|uniref:DKNYY domain-containing protein n=1 Tax=Hyphomonas sp. TaxID=87 RepID=UPI0035638533